MYFLNNKKLNLHRYLNFFKKLIYFINIFNILLGIKYVILKI